MNRFDGAPLTAQYQEIFDQFWTNSDELGDVTQAVIDHIVSAYAENAPERIHFRMLYDLFAEFLSGISASAPPNDRADYLDTSIWNGLYAFERDAATEPDASTSRTHRAAHAPDAQNPALRH